MAKPHKVQEPAGTYAAKAQGSAKPKAEDVRYLAHATAQKIADRLFRDRKNLLQKLAK